jgi:hypothetical protein
MPSGVGTRRTTEPLAKFSCEMSVVAKATGIGDVAERTACAQQPPAMHQVRDVIQAKRIDEFTAGRAALRTELLYAAQRDPCFVGDLGRAEIGSAKRPLMMPRTRANNLSVWRETGLESDGANSAATDHRPRAACTNRPARTLIRRLYRHPEQGRRVASRPVHGHASNGTVRACTGKSAPWAHDVRRPAT